MNNFKKIFLCLSILFFMIYNYVFLYNPFDKQEYSYDGIPTVFLYGDIDKMESKEDERIVKFSYLSNDISFMKYAKIKIQGSSSSRYEKKNYTIKLYDTYECEDKFKVDFGWGEENKYVIKANWIDKTHARNIVSSRLVSSVSEKYGFFDSAPNNASVDGFPIEVYINGEFLGLYTFNIPKDAWMLGLDEDNSNHVAFDAEYNLDQTFFREEPTYEQWSVEVGIQNEENLEKLNRLYNFINRSSDKEFKEDFSNYFNFDVVLNYYVLSEIFCFDDNAAKNMILITYDGKQWYPVLYDLDTSFGSGFYGDTLFEYDHLVDFSRNLLWERFIDLFDSEIRDRYFELRKEILTLDYIYSYIDEFVSAIPEESLKKEQERWDNIPGYDVEQMKSFIKDRLDYLDDYFDK